MSPQLHNHISIAIMSSFPSFAWSWDANPELNDPSLNSPMPCKWGSNCYYTDCCRFVHPGEEGTGRKLFPGRCIIGQDGVQVWQPEIVRLIGRPHFYERRRLHLSWPKWCDYVGVKTSPTLPRNEVKLFEPEPVSPVSSYEKRRQIIGTTIFNLVSYELENGGREALVKGNMWSPAMTPQKITGMLIEGDNLVKMEEMFSSNNYKEIINIFSSLMADACEVLYDAQPPNREEICC